MSIKDKLKVGDRVRLIEMVGDPDPVAPDTEGTVTYLADLHTVYGHNAYQIGVRWDNGRTLSLCELDRWEKVNDQFCEQGIHSWVGEHGKLPADTPCDRCGELYGDPS